MLHVLNFKSPSIALLFTFRCLVDKSLMINIYVSPNFMTAGDLLVEPGV